MNFSPHITEKSQQYPVYDQDLIFMFPKTVKLCDINFNQINIMERSLNNMNKIILIPSLILLASCASTAPKITLLDDAKNIKIFRKVDPPISCNEITTIVVSHGNGCGAFGAVGNFDDVYKAFKNEVVNNKGNAALLQSETPPHSSPNCWVNEYVMRGIVYACPVEVISN
jgi:hypothetical protein